MTSTALILGAETQLGHALVEAFVRAGWRVVAQIEGRTMPALPAGVAVEHDARVSPAELVRRHGRIAAIAHVAMPREAREAVPRLHAAIETARACEARLLLPATLRNYALPAPAPIAESFPQGATTRSGEIGMLLEATLAGACAHGVRGAVLRAGDLVGGARPGGCFDRLVVRGLLRGVVRYPGPLDRAHPWQDVDDLAACYVRLAERDADLPAFARFHVPGASVTGEALVAAIDRAAFRLGLLHPAASLRVARPPSWWLAALVHGWDAPGPRASWQQPHALDGAALRALLGDAMPAMRPLNDTVERALRRAPRFQRALQRDPPRLRASHGAW